MIEDLHKIEFVDFNREDEHMNSTAATVIDWLINILILTGVFFLGRAAVRKVRRVK